MADAGPPQNLFGLTDPNSVNLSSVEPWQVTCFLNNQNESDTSGDLQGARISAVFVLLVTSTLVTLFPVVAVRSKRIRIPLYVYLFARYFGAGVIVATAFVHLLDPGYSAIGPASCVGLTNGWSGYSWPPAIAMVSAFLVFLMDFAAERYVEKKYGFTHGEPAGGIDMAMARYSVSGVAERKQSSHQFLHSGEQDGTLPTSDKQVIPKNVDLPVSDSSSLSSEAEKQAFLKQISAFLILEFGVIFHSVIIGLTLGSAGDEFKTLYPVIVFHQAFEGLGIGARLSAIPFPPKHRLLPWILCISYGITTPIAVGIGLGIRYTYDANSMTASIVSGVLDSFSAGILIYTGWVELLARDFLFNPDRTNNDKQLAFMLCSTLLGAAIMALLGKWA